MHIPVLLNKTIEALNIQPGGRYIDCTVGSGGHAAAILEHSAPGGQLLGIDLDSKAIEVAKTRLEALHRSIRLVNDNFANLQDICMKYDFFPVHGILLDLGLCSLQLDSDERGFSFQSNAPLDMRLSPTQEITAADIVNKSSEAELARIINTYGEERFSHRIASRIAKERPVKTTHQLAQIVEQAIGGRREKIHPATRTFQALRIAVNNELENLEAALRQSVNLLGINGRLVVISYHSLEDRIVKQFIQREAKDCICPPKVLTCVCEHKASLRIVNKKVITPSLAEIKLNPRSRSAKLRVTERVAIQSEQLYYHDIAESLVFPAGIEAREWKRPDLVEKLRRTLIAS